MKNLYVILWVINFFIGTGLLSGELQEEGHFSSFPKHNVYFESCNTDENIQHHTKAFPDFDFEFFISVDNLVQLPVHGNRKKVYSLIFASQILELPALCDLPPPYTV